MGVKAGLAFQGVGDNLTSTDFFLLFQLIRKHAQNTESLENAQAAEAQFASSHGIETKQAVFALFRAVLNRSGVQSKHTWGRFLFAALVQSFHLFIYM